MNNKVSLLSYWCRVALACHVIFIFCVLLLRFTFFYSNDDSKSKKIPKLITVK